jgi:hypothetical protein
MSAIGVILLAAAVVLLVVAEWPRIARRSSGPFEERAPKASRTRAVRRRHLRVVEPDSDPDEFQRAVERDLANLPTYDPRAKRD